MKWLVAMMLVGMVYFVSAEHMPTYAETGRITTILLVIAFFALGMREANGKRKNQ